MDSSDIDGVNHGLPMNVNNIVESLDDLHLSMPTMEECRSIFDDNTKNYIGPMDQLSVEGITNNFEKQFARVKRAGRVLYHLDSEQIILKYQQ
ncbi:hypothetical protein [Photobacterium marinum]|uniref:hypothetical protein n=1 Tax=Photobacterium marinum TaxID=1056511 RepID=UPI00031E766E|nr:hypothetical protein [Photobacterium marinum]